ncbi:hypothetical protein [Solemya velesiana gill symbiont]|uniref:hypothetical protein n=1 Tax=Solemya velesiana gill symbiont TaxID=1918948 RepID=UPI0015614D0A|nr:hypothetical protein [Solemya velesiana gill symbiont]
MNSVIFHVQPAVFINPPSYREKNGGGLTAVRFLLYFPFRRRFTAEYGGLAD